MRVGIVGAGAMGAIHAAGWRAAGADLLGVVSDDHSSAAGLADRHGARTFQEVDDLLSEVDVVDLCVPYICC